MKKNLILKISIFTVISLVLFSLVISSCNFKFGEVSGLTEPTVDYSAPIVTLSIPKQSKYTDHINIYRQDITEYNEEDYSDSTPESRSIGLIFPKALEAVSGGSVYQYHDTEICDNHKYRYRVRYFEKRGDRSKCYFTEWSKVIAIPKDTAYPESTTDDDFTYQLKDTSFDYDKLDFTLTLKGSITAPAVLNSDANAINAFLKKYKPALLVKKDKEEKVFQLPQSIIEKIENDTAGNEKAGSDVKFSIRNLLSEDFVGEDIEIQISGILAQYKQYNTEDTEADSTTTETDENASESTESTEEDLQGDVIRVIWTLPKEIPLTYYQDNKISIDSASQGNGFDFSQTE